MKANFKVFLECTVVLVYLIFPGLSECSWSSCREGCTGQKAECHQIYVSFKPLSPETVSTSTSSSAPIQTVAPLKVTVKGCGYPPSVNCSTWLRQFGRNNSNFPCYYSE